MASSVMRTLSACTLSLIVLGHVLPTYQQNVPILMPPEDTRAANGTDAIFYCKVRTGNRELVYWVVDRVIGLGPSTNNNRAYPRYEIFGDSSRGYYNLRIKNVVQSDAVQYDCVVTHALGETSNYEAGAMLTVVSEAVVPTTSADELCIDSPVGEITFDEGQELPNYRCQATGGAPIGELRWNLLREDRSLVDVGYDIQVAGETITATSSSYRLSGYDHESMMMCSLSHPSLSSDRTCSYPTTPERILVRHHPLIDFGPGIDITYLEATSVIIRCSASAYPDVSPFYPELIFSDPNMVYNITRREWGRFVEARVDVSQRSDIGKHINCTAENMLGVTTATLEIRLNPILPTWLLLTVLLIIIVILIAFVLCCCACCCKPDRKDQDETDRPDREPRAAGYDVSPSRGSSMYKSNGVREDHSNYMDDDSFGDMALNDYSGFPPPLSLPQDPNSNDLETGEVNDGYLTPSANDRFPPMIEDEHLMGDKSVTSFSGDSAETMPPPPSAVPPPPPPPP